MCHRSQKGNSYSLLIYLAFQRIYFLDFVLLIFIKQHNDMYSFKKKTILANKMQNISVYTLNIKCGSSIATKSTWEVPNCLFTYISNVGSCCLKNKNVVLSLHIGVYSRNDTEIITYCRKRFLTISNCFQNKKNCADNQSPIYDVFQNF